jgi:predicted DsbA family dithiol-disulfide isomerase
MTEVLTNPQPQAPKEVAFAVLRVPFFLEPHADESVPFVGTNRQRLLEKWGGPAGTFFCRCCAPGRCFVCRLHWFVVLSFSHWPHQTCIWLLLCIGWEAQKRRHDLKGRGLAAGIPYFNLDRLVGNTMASHRLIQMVGKLYGLRVSEQVYDLLNEYYFVQGHSLNDQPRLAQVVAELLQQLAVVPPASDDDLLSFLRSDLGRDEIETALAALHELNIHSIPKFVIEGTTVIDGAATADVFIKLFRRIERRGTIDAEPVFASLLGIDPSEIEPSHTRDHFVTAGSSN